MSVIDQLPTAEESLARLLPPKEFYGHAVVAVGDHLTYKPYDKLQDDDVLVFFDGDHRDVLRPDDPRLK